MRKFCFIFVWTCSIDSEAFSYEKPLPCNVKVTKTGKKKMNVEKQNKTKQKLLKDSKRICCKNE